MFENEENQILASLKTENPAKSWLIIGEKGIGKSAFSKKLIQKLTKNYNDYNPSVQWIECGLTDAAKKEIQKAILAGEKPNEKEWSKKTEITVDDVRQGCHFLSLKSNQIKVLVINLADDMNENAQNALLKTLEEPYPNTLILLLCENIGHLLPTIKSRCQQVHLLPPKEADFVTTLSQKHPHLSSDEKQEIQFLSDNIIGQAEAIIQMDGLEIYHQLVDILSNPLNPQRIVNFAEQVIQNPKYYLLTTDIVLKYLSFKAKEATSFSLEKAFDITNLYEKIKHLIQQTDSLNLDKKQTMITIIHQISESL